MPETSDVLDTVEKCAAKVRSLQLDDGAWGVLLLGKDLALLGMALPESQDEKPTAAVDRALRTIRDQRPFYSVLFDRVGELMDFPTKKQLDRFLEVREVLRRLGIRLVDRLVVDAAGRYLSREANGPGSSPAIEG